MRVGQTSPVFGSKSDKQGLCQVRGRGEGPRSWAVTRAVTASELKRAATDHLALRAALSADRRRVEPDLVAVAEILRRAADLSLELFESIALVGHAHRVGEPVVIVNRRSGRRSAANREVIALESLRDVVGRHITEPRHGALANAGLDLWRFIGASQLLATHYSLSVAIDPKTQEVERFAITPALEAMLASGEKQIQHSLRALERAAIDSQITTALYEIGLEEAKLALAGRDGPMLVRSLRYMWGTRVIVGAFMLSPRLGTATPRARTD